MCRRHMILITQMKKHPEDVLIATEGSGEQKKNTNGDKIPEPQNKIATNTLKYIVIVKNNKNI